MISFIGFFIIKATRTPYICAHERESCGKKEEKKANTVFKFTHTYMISLPTQ